MNTSYSALDTFQTCQLKYKFQVIDKIKTPKGADAVFGTLIHSTMKFIHDGGFVLPTQKEALQFFTTNWNPEVFPDEIQERMAFAQGIKIIQDYYKRNNPTDIQIVDLESRFSIEIADANEKHLISGIIDRIDKTEKGYEIIDYKTNRKLPAQDRIDDNLQLLIYLLAFLKRYPDQEEKLDDIQLSLYFLKHGVKLSTSKTKTQLEECKMQILDIIHEIQQSKFEPNISALCNWCGFQKICPMWKHKFKEKEQKIPDDEEKKKIIDEYINLSVQIKADKKKMAELQAQIAEIMENDQVERLFGDGMIIAKSVRKTYRYDEVKLKEILMEVGLWDNVVKVDNTRLKKALESLTPMTRKSIEALKELDKESSSLTLKKDKIDVELED